MPTAYVSIGSNVEAAANVRAAVQALRARFGPLRLSPVYGSRAVGFAGEDFLNLAAAFDTDQAPESVAAALREIEDARGRVRTGPKFSDRTLDLDLVLYGDAVRRQGPVRLPRSEVLEHAHVLRPLADIAGDVRHPTDGRTLGELWAAFPSVEGQLWPVDLGLGPG